MASQRVESAPKYNLRGQSFSENIEADIVISKLFLFYW